MIKLIDAICFCGIPDHDLPSPISQVADSPSAKPQRRQVEFGKGKRESGR